MAETQSKREMLASRLGFLLISAGCAVGLGNVWRFPFITGEYGGACFLLVFVVCQLMVMPVMIAEFAIGRASRRTLGLALKTLEPKGTWWHRFGWIAIVGSYILLMFYTTVCGWMLIYCVHMLQGTFHGMPPAEVGKFFGGMLGSPSLQITGMTASVLVGALVCASGLQNGVERVVKVMMAGLFLILIALVIHSVSLPGATEGLKFYLMPDVERFQKVGFLPIASAALNQAFFTLSIGIGSMCIFGSYLTKDHSLTGEVCLITGMDFLVALLAGCIIFPACFAFGVTPNAGPGLVFVTLPNVFSSMDGGRFWGALFFVFLSFAALTTVIAVFENMVACLMDMLHMPRRRAVFINAVLLWMLSLPCALGFNLLSGFEPMGKGSSFLDLEDFIVSNNLLPLGSLMMVLFCTMHAGWGWDKFAQEADMGSGLRLSRHPALRFYLRWILPAVILVLFVTGYVDKFGG